MARLIVTLAVVLALSSHTSFAQTLTVADLGVFAGESKFSGNFQGNPAPAPRSS